MITGRYITKGAGTAIVTRLYGETFYGAAVERDRESEITRAGVHYIAHAWIVWDTETGVAQRESSVFNTLAREGMNRYDLIVPSISIPHNQQFVKGLDPLLDCADLISARRE